MKQTLKVLGPPGTGKTRYLLERLELELRETPASRVAFLTFTRAARAEALERTGKSEDEFPYLRTIHSICYRQLGLLQNQVVKPKDLRFFGKQLGVRLTGTYRDPWAVEDLLSSFHQPTAADQLLQLNHLGRHRRIRLSEAMRFANLDVDLKYAKWFTLAYRDWKEKESLYDYTDMLTSYLEYGAPLPVDVMFVDESQDLSSLQWEVVHKLGQNAARVYLAGDDDQAIFQWAGASADLFMKETCDAQHELVKSYRLPRAVHLKAKEIITRVLHRIPKNPEPHREGGEVRTAAALSEDLLSGPGQTFILFRNHHRGAALAEQMETLSWPFLGGGSVLSVPEVRSALLAWDKMCTGQPATVAQCRALLSFSSRDWIESSAKERLAKMSGLIRVDTLFFRRHEREEWRKVLAALPGISYISRALHFHGWDRVINPTTSLLSIHQSKGREADTVIVDTEMARKTYDSWLVNPDDEHRVWYVGVTRSRDRLFTLLPTDTKAYTI